MQLILQLRNTIREKQIATNIDEEMLENPAFLRMKPAAVFRGQLYAILSYFPTQALSFWIKERVKSVFCKFKSPSDSALLQVSKSIVRGGVSGSLSLAFVYSLAQMQQLYALGIEDKQRWSLGPLHSGLPIACCGIFLYRALYFVLYDSSRGMLGEKPSLLSQFLLGYGVTVGAGLLSYPLDTIRRRQLLTDEDAMQAAKNLVDKYGWMSLWDGASCNIVRGMMGTAVLMMAPYIGL